MAAVARIVSLLLKRGLIACVSGNEIDSQTQHDTAVGYEEIERDCDDVGACASIHVSCIGRLVTLVGWRHNPVITQNPKTQDSQTIWNTY